MAAGFVEGVVPVWPLTVCATCGKNVPVGGRCVGCGWPDRSNTQLVKAEPRFGPPSAEVLREALVPVHWIRRWKWAERAQPSIRRVAEPVLALGWWPVVLAELVLRLNFWRDIETELTFASTPWVGRVACIVLGSQVLVGVPWLLLQMARERARRAKEFLLGYRAIRGPHGLCCRACTSSLPEGEVLTGCPWCGALNMRGLEWLPESPRRDSSSPDPQEFLRSLRAMRTEVCGLERISLTALAGFLVLTALSLKLALEAASEGGLIGLAGIDILRVGALVLLLAHMASTATRGDEEVASSNGPEAFALSYVVSVFGLMAASAALVSTESLTRTNCALRPWCAPLIHLAPPVPVRHEPRDESLSSHTGLSEDSGDIEHAYRSRPADTGSSLARDAAEAEEISGPPVPPGPGQTVPDAGQPESPKEIAAEAKAAQVQRATVDLKEAVQAYVDHRDELLADWVPSLPVDHFLAPERTALVKARGTLAGLIEEPNHDLMGADDLIGRPEEGCASRVLRFKVADLKNGVGPLRKISCDGVTFAARLHTVSREAWERPSGEDQPEDLEVQIVPDGFDWDPVRETCTLSCQRYLREKWAEGDMTDTWYCNYPVLPGVHCGQDSVTLWVVLPKVRASAAKE